MKRPLWLIFIATVMLIGLIISQFVWVVKSADQQEEQFNTKVELAMSNIEERIVDDQEVCSSIGGCLMEEEMISCSKSLCGDDVWARTDTIVSEELSRFDIDLDYEFDVCRANRNSPFDKSTTHTQEMEEVFNQSGIVLYLDFPDKWDYLRNQMGGVFISSILLIVFLSIVFVLTYRYYRKERAFSLRTRDFINNMTHEFKTPLTNISLANRMLSNELESSQLPELKKYSLIIDEENARLVKNTEDLLQIAKIENMTAGFGEVINTHEIINDVIVSFASVNSTGTVEFETDLAAEKHHVYGKETYFFNTLKNLIDNAIKYSNNTVKIRVSTRNVGGKLQLDVSDDGIGMSNEQVQNIFDKFYRVSEGDDHNVKGFGLGLSYVKTVITKMNGRIKVLSRPGKGSTFGISLPIATS